MKKFLVGLNFQEFIEANDEDEAIEKFGDRYKINCKYLDAEEVEDED